MRAVVALAAASAVVLAGACRQPPREIPVGAFLALSGAESTSGSEMREGIELALDELNAAGGIEGRKVRVIYEDDASRAEDAKEGVRRLVTRDGVVAVLGEVSSSRTLAGAEAASALGVPMITPSSTAIEVTRGRPWVFRTCFTDDQQGRVAARFVKRELHASKAALLHAEGDPYAAGLSAVFREEAAALGISVVADETYPKGTIDFRPRLAAIAEAHPDVVFVPSYQDDVVLIARQAAEKGIPGSKLFGGDGWDSPRLLVGAGSELEGAHFTDHWAPDAPWPRSKEFVAAYRRKYKREPPSLAAQGYDGARVLFDAMRRAPDLGRESIRTAVSETVDFPGVTGPITIDAAHDATKPVVVVKVGDGAFRFVAERTTAP